MGEMTVICSVLSTHPDRLPLAIPLSYPES